MISAKAELSAPENRCGEFLFSGQTTKSRAVKRTDSFRAFHGPYGYELLALACECPPYIMDL